MSDATQAGSGAPGYPTHGSTEPEIRQIAGSGADHEASLDLRHRVMYEPLGLGRDLAAGHEPEDSVHIAAFAGDDLVGYVRLVPVGPEAVKVYQVCVEPALQSTGLGTRLVRTALGRALGMGVRDVHLDARAGAVGFYERFGFAQEGPEFASPRTGTPHRAMRLTLPAGA